MKTVLVIAYSKLISDPRVMRHILFLRNHYNVIACGLEDPQVHNVAFIQVGKDKKSFKNKLVSLFRLISGLFEGHYWSYDNNKSAYEQLKDLEFDLIIANDIHTLPLSVKLARGRSIVYDAHEYAPLQREDNLLWSLLMKRYIHNLCRTYLPQATKMITVSAGIAGKYKEVFNVRPDIISNAPFYVNIGVKKTSAAKIRLIHHGAGHPSRSIDQMIYLLDYLDQRFELDLMLVDSGSPAYMKKVNLLAGRRKGVRIIPPVKMDQIVDKLTEYDIGLFLLKPVNYNYKMALPNKLFEFIQARLAVAVGPSPEMQAVVEKYDCGVVARDFTPTAMAEKLLELDAERIDYYKTRSDAAAKELSADNNRERFLRLVEEAMN